MTAAPLMMRSGTAAAVQISRGASGWALFTLLLICPLSAAAGETSEPAPRAAQALLLGIANTGSQLIAVGDHGIVIVSRDQGANWSQRLTPTHVLLTSVCFPDPQFGWAVGHDGVIIATRDGGGTWVRQDDGTNLDTVFLTVYFRDTLHGFAAGAYGKFFATSDGGKTWIAAHPSADEVHYNRITAGPDGYLYLAGESGTVLVSANGGRDWTKAEVPYEGSLFGVLPLENGRIVTYGLRGHILRSDDHGTGWATLDSAVQVLIMGGTRLHTGTVVLGGQGGNFYISRDTGQTFTHWKSPDFGTSVADIIEGSDGSIITVGEAGAVRLKLP